MSTNDNGCTVYVHVLNKNNIKNFKSAYSSSGLDIPFNLGEDLYIDRYKYEDNVIIMKLGIVTYSPIDLLMIPRSGTSLVEKFTFGELGSKNSDLEPQKIEIYNKSSIRLANTVGFIDHDYRGEWQARIMIDSRAPNFCLKKGKAYLQMVPFNYHGPVFYQIVKTIEDVPAHLRETERGTGGFNSSDNPGG
jgi:hypothetical protein